jgi:hypothetical protein
MASTEISSSPIPKKGNPPMADTTEPRWHGSWIWCAAATPQRNAFARFRRRFTYRGGEATLHITADARYMLYVNDEYIGQGPVRAWPSHWRYDSYDLAPHLTPGENVIAVLVNHYGESTFQYIHGPAGLLAHLALADEDIVSDAGWRAAPDPALVNNAPRISIQEAFEEQYDARLADGRSLPGHVPQGQVALRWAGAGYDDSAWPAAVALRPAEDGWHRDLGPRAIPFLTLEPALPRRIVSAETVRSIRYRHTIYVKPYLAPTDFSSNANAAHAYLATQVWSPDAAEVRVFAPHKVPWGVEGQIFKVNGAAVEQGAARLRRGWNSLVLSIASLYHLPEFVVCLDGPDGLALCAAGDRGGAPWAVVGPFDIPEEFRRALSETFFGSTLIVAEPRTPEATAERGAAFWESGDVAAVLDAPFFSFKDLWQPVAPEHLPEVDVFMQAYTDTVTGQDVRVETPEALLSAAEWATIYPAADGADVRVLLDFGREVVGFHAFEVDAPAGTILDWHNFEFIQPDGRFNFAEGMNNSFRYVCREGRQAYQSFVRRGFRYSYLILRGMTGPVKLRDVRLIFNTYPQARQGSFVCSDARLDQIWEVGAHTLRCSAEDTYVDTPVYEQTHWVGDARNEALVDWVVNGDRRLWFRCLEQAGQSLERSPLVESHVPSGWQNVIPAWTFLWMRSCREYLLFTGDDAGAGRLLEDIARNVAGVEAHLNPQGLFDIHAWNMFDWAAMDTPNYGVVTHQNCLAVQALRDAAEMAEWLDRPELASDWRETAEGIAAAVNAHLWNEERQAYTDCLREGRHSTVFSQQTQTAALISGVATGGRAARCRQIIEDPPEGFVRAGSPFFEFFLLEAYQAEGREQEVVSAIRRDWGWMVEMGATTFWESWSGAGAAEEGRLTRSHCHGWSAAPTYFLSTYVLGVRPGGPGFRPVVIEPHPADLNWCRGVVPTPYGNVEVQWDSPADGEFALRVRAPDGAELDIRLPRVGRIQLNGRAVAPGRHTV